jgi:hypothetical protein
LGISDDDDDAVCNLGNYSNDTTITVMLCLSLKVADDDDDGGWDDSGDGGWDEDLDDLSDS